MTKALENGETDVYDAGSLIDFSTQLLLAAGLEQEKADAVAGILVEGDLMGHSTHGLQLLPSYLECLEDGTMKKEGNPDVISDHGSGFAWDGQYLPGPWLTLKALDMAIERVSAYPVVTVTIQKSHHIGCLAAYMEKATAKNLLMWLTCSDPSVQSVAPFGGIQPLYTPNPIAAGIPTTSDPIIFDISMSAVANGVIAKADRESKLLDGKWILDNRGEATDDPKAFFADPPGTVLPLGGTDLGYKGFALGLFVEALTAGLCGHGRSNNPQEWGASVFLQVINPAMFGGTESFLKETGWFSDAVKATPAAKEETPVRLPGHLALQKKKLQLKEGVKLSGDLIGSLKSCSKQFQVSFPRALSRKAES
jgi:LDH2 family malate/lactate/ureidoglycolate dehydrogenase